MVPSRMTQVGFAVLGALLCASTAHAAEWINPVAGNWTDGTKWSTGSEPTSTDPAVFPDSGSFIVTVTGFHDAKSLSVTAPTVRFSGTAGNRIIDLVNDLFVNGGTIDLDDMVVIKAGDTGVGAIRVRSGATINVQTASALWGDRLNIGEAGTGTDNAINLIGGQLATKDTSGTNNFIGRSGSTGRLVLSASATANFAHTIGMADSASNNSKGYLDVLTNSTLTARGILIATRGIPGQDARLTVSGSGSLAEQDAWGNDLTIGAASNSTGELLVSSSGRFETAPFGQVTVHNTGAITLTSGGQFDLRSNMLIDGGLFTGSAAGLNFVDTGVGSAVGIDIRNGGKLDLTSSLIYTDDAAITLADTASELEVTNFIVHTSITADTGSIIDVDTLSVHEGAVTAADTGTTIDVAGDLSIGSPDVGSRLVTIENDAIATIGDDLYVGRQPTISPDRHPFARRAAYSPARMPHETRKAKI